MIYGNLRMENIIIKLDRKNEKIERIRFLGFGSLTTIENSEFMNIPEQLEHLPPDMTSHLLTLHRFSRKTVVCCSKMKNDAHSKKEVNVKFLQAAASADTFALGVMLL